MLSPVAFPQAETISLLAALLSLPHPARVTRLFTLSPQKRKEKTQEALVAWLCGGSGATGGGLRLGRSALG